MNEVVLKIINTCERYERGETLSIKQSHWIDSKKLDFHNSSIENLPIPVPSNTRPNNAHQFITHIVLPLGNYDTEVDTLTYSTIRKRFSEDWTYWQRN